MAQPAHHRRFRPLCPHRGRARLGDRCTDWLTLNEVACFAEWGHYVDKPYDGLNAPAVQCSSAIDRTNTVLHAMLAHGEAVRAIRAASPRPCKIGWAHNEGAQVPITESAADIAATKQHFIDACSPLKLYAALTGKLPSAWVERGQRERWLGEVTEADLRTISAPVEQMGLNVYTAGYIAAGPDGQPMHLPLTKNYPQFGDLGWPTDGPVWRGEPGGHQGPDRPYAQHAR